jgi:hypothetical protein
MQVVLRPQEGPIMAEGTRRNCFRAWCDCMAHYDSESPNWSAQGRLIPIGDLIKYDWADERMNKYIACGNCWSHLNVHDYATTVPESVIYEKSIWYLRKPEDISAWRKTIEVHWLNGHGRSSLTVGGKPRQRHYAFMDANRKQLLYHWDFDPNEWNRDFWYRMPKIWYVEEGDIIRCRGKGDQLYEVLDVSHAVDGDYDHDYYLVREYGDRIKAGIKVLPYDIHLVYRRF